MTNQASLFNSAARPESEYLVVFNDEGQYSVWPSHQPLPHGWNSDGTRGSKDECLDHIELTWTDMRPRSLRRQTQPQPQ